MQEVIADLQARVATLERKVAELAPPVLDIPWSSEIDPVPGEPLGETRPSVPDVVAREDRRGSTEDEVLGKWFPRLGALALVLGAAFGFRYAVDRGWIGPALRVMLGLVLGGGLVAAGEASKRAGWAPYASAISGGGVGVLYLSVWASIRLYGLVPPAPGLLALAAVSGLGIWLAVRHDAEPLAAIALFGGFVAPFAAGAAHGAPGVVYAYVLCLDVVAITLGIRNNWRITERLAFVGSWAVVPVGVSSFSLWITGTTAIFLMFGAVPFVKALRGQTHARVSDLAAVVTNGAVYYLALLVELPQDSHALVTAVLGAVYGLVALALWQGAPGAVLLRSTTAGMALAFTFVWVPVALPLEQVPLTWAIGSLGIVGVTGWIRATQSGRAAWGTVAGWVVLAAAIATQLTTVTLGLEEVVHTAHGRIVFVIGVTVLGVVAHVERRWPSSTVSIGTPAVVGANVLALSWLGLELYSFLAGGGVRPDPADLQFGLSALGGVYAAGLLAAGLALRSTTCRVMSIALFGAVVAKMALHDLWLLDTLQRLIGFMGIGALLLVASFGYNAFKDMLFGEGAAR